MLKNTFFYVHIPKTGGTSLRKAFENLVGSSNTYYDYHEASKTTDKLIRQIRYCSKDLFSIYESDVNISEATLICGHVNIMEYANLISPEKIFTFIRDPVERVISHYEHAKRIHGYKGSLNNFCCEEKFRNIQHKMLKGYPLQAIGFIGITDDYSKSLELLRKQYNFEVPMLNLNKNRKRVDNSNYRIDKKTTALILSMNELDSLLFSRAKRILSNRVETSQESLLYGLVEKLSQSRVSGWCYKVTNCTAMLTIEVIVNGLVDGYTTTTIYRPFFKQINAPREGYVGFDYIFSKKISHTDKVRCRIKETNYYLTNISGDSFNSSA